MLSTIYVVEDDEAIRELLKCTLETTNMEYSGFEEADSFFKALSSKKPDLILLDIMLPKRDGFSILQELKQSSQTKDIPVIMLTARSKEWDKVKGLEGGADDYITKPFGVLELIARIKAVLRRGENREKSKSAEVIELNGIMLDKSRHIVEIEGKNIELTFKEFELLRVLMENSGIVLNREKLLDIVWGFEYTGETRTVDMHIKTLRQKLGQHAKNIITIRGIGYKLNR